jgi:phospholipid-transporting ATPase
MEFKKFSAGSFSYGHLESKHTPHPSNLNLLATVMTPGARKTVENVNFEDRALWEHMSAPENENYTNIERFIMHMALCHSIVLDERTGRYNASSPDELALVNAAKFFGAEFKKRDDENRMIVEYQGKQRFYRLLNILEFTSTRKRMSVIVEDLNDPQQQQGGDIYVLTKGADSIIIPRLNVENSPYLKETERFVDQYA